ncbi:MAG: DUF4368 domain-containing protein [Erysipelotrichaceae bacterium]|nr:DUF4368 domain-containing protein [Erysipelotrichaceae bacterium]
MHYIREDDLKALVLKNIQEVIQKTLSDPQQFSEDLLKKMNNDSQLSINRNLQQKQEIEKKLKETDNKLSRLYDDYYSEKINIRNFEKLSKKFQDEQDHCLKEIENINLVMSKQDDDLHNIEQWIDLVEKYKNITELDFEIVHKLISKVIVHEREVTDEGTVSQKVEIIYNFIGAIDE